MLATLGSAFFFAIMGLLVKLAAHVPTNEIVLFRSAIMAFLMTPALWRSWPVVRRHARWLVFRGLLGTVALFFYFGAIARIPYSNANLLCNLSPLFTAMLAAWFLQERLSPRVRYALPIALAGVFFIVRPIAGVSFDTVGYVIGFLSGVFSGASCAAVRKLTQDVSPEVVVGVFSWVSVGVGIPLCAPAWQVPDRFDSLLLLGVGLMATAAQLLMTIGYRDLSAAVAGTVGLTQVLMAALLAVLFLHEHPDGWQLLGMVTVVSSVAWLTLEDWQPTPSFEPKAQS